MNIQSKIIQITAGRGPLECCRVVKKVNDLIMKDAVKYQFVTEVINTTEASMNGTLYSATIMITGYNIDVFVQQWQGTIQWISKSPYRKFHKRKNWFVGVDVFDMSQILKFEERDIEFQTQRASGAGGQHVNKTESSVRAIHLPTKLFVVCADQRSQQLNKKLAIERLRLKVQQAQIEQLAKDAQIQWQQHNVLERGNPVKIFDMEL
jgi:peptide chain release factor